MRQCMSETQFLKFTTGNCNLRQFRKMGRYCNHYYEKVTKAIKLKCGYDFDYIIKYVWTEKNFGNCNYRLVRFVL